MGRTWEPQGRQHPCLEEYQPAGFLALACGLGGWGWVMIQPRPREGQSGEVEPKWMVRSLVGLERSGEGMFPVCAGLEP